MKLPLEKCANGDGNPVCPPSLVICRACLDKIGANLRDMQRDLERRATTPERTDP